MERNADICENTDTDLSASTSSTIASASEYHTADLLNILINDPHQHNKYDDLCLRGANDAQLDAQLITDLLNIMVHANVAHKVIFLELRFMDLRLLPSINFSSFVNLRCLQIDNCHLLAPPFINNCLRLRYVSLDNNALTIAPRIHNLCGLLVLNIAHNPLTKNEIIGLRWANKNMSYPVLKMDYANLGYNLHHINCTTQSISIIIGMFYNLVQAITDIAAMVRNQELDFRHTWVNTTVNYNRNAANLLQSAATTSTGNSSAGNLEDHLYAELAANKPLFMTTLKKCIKNGTLDKIFPENSGNNNIAVLSEDVLSRYDSLIQDVNMIIMGTIQRISTAAGFAECMEMAKRCCDTAVTHLDWAILRILLQCCKHYCFGDNRIKIAQIYNTLQDNIPDSRMIPSVWTPDLSFLSRYISPQTHFGKFYPARTPILLPWLLLPMTDHYWFTDKVQLVIYKNRDNKKIYKVRNYSEYKNYLLKNPSCNNQYHYIISPHGGMYLAPSDSSFIRHSSFRAGGHVICAGSLEVAIKNTIDEQNNPNVNIQTVSINNFSGHYKPSPLHLRIAAIYLSYTIKLPLDCKVIAFQDADSSTHPTIHDCRSACPQYENHLITYMSKVYTNNMQAKKVRTEIELNNFMQQWFATENVKEHVATLEQQLRSKR